MVQIKVFQGDYYNADEINEWLSKSPNIKLLSVTHTPMYDYHSNVTPLTICNQWIATTVTYVEWR